jgi:hypothetical protein
MLKPSDWLPGWSTRLFKTVFERTLILFGSNFNDLLVWCVRDSFTISFKEIVLIRAIEVELSIYLFKVFPTRNTRSPDPVVY